MCRPRFQVHTVLNQVQTGLPYGYCLRLKTKLSHLQNYQICNLPKKLGQYTVVRLQNPYFILLLFLGVLG